MPQNYTLAVQWLQKAVAQEGHGKAQKLLAMVAQKRSNEKWRASMEAFFNGPEVIESIAVCTGFALALLLIYVGFCLFVRWLRAWKPVPKGIRVVAWILYAFAVLACAGGYRDSEFLTVLVFLPIVVLTPLCYLATVVYRKNHITSEDTQTDDTHLGPVFFLILAIITMALILLIYYNPFYIT